MINYLFSVLSISTYMISCAAFVPNMHINIRTSFVRQIELNAVDVVGKDIENTIITENKNGTGSELISKINIEKSNIVEKKEKPVVKKKSNPSHKEGVFSPVVFLAKDIMGDENLIKLRAKMISIHSDVISSFVNTYETAYGKSVLKILYFLADKNKDGSLDENELKSAFYNMGFKWIQDKQLKGIMKRADVDGNNVIDFQEFCNEVPRTLRINLIKLAKTNGGEMGLLV